LHTIERRQRLRAKMKDQGLSAMIITSQENRFYLSGFSGSAGHLIVTPDTTVLITDGRYWAQVQDQCQQVELVRFRAEEHGSLIQASAAWLANTQGRVAVESRHLVVGDWQTLCHELEGKDIKPEAADNLIEQIRQCKDGQEIERLRRAAQIADRALRNALESLREGITEREFCLELEYQMQKLGARKPAFDSIVASGPNGAFPHAGVTDRVIAQRELITLDFGAYHDSYNSDMTRTVWMGNLNERNAFIYQSVRDAQRKAVDAVRPGIRCRELDAIAREHLHECGLGEYFSHSLGHGIGLAVHELPGLRSTTETMLEPGMLITIEPGVYIPGETGCRIEDTVLVTETGGEKITRSPYQELGQIHPLETVGA